MSWFSSVRSTDTALYSVVFIIAFISPCILVPFHDLLALVSCLGTNTRSSFSLIYSQIWFLSQLFCHEKHEKIMYFNHSRMFSLYLFTDCGGLCP